MKKLLVAVLLLSGCVTPGARFMGMHSDHQVFEVTCARNTDSCNQLARHACRNGDWRVVLSGESTATSNHFWLECEF